MDDARRANRAGGVVAPYIIIVPVPLRSAILTEAARSVLGLGAAEPTPSWGLMLSGSAPSYAEKAPWIALFPSIAISLGIFGFNLFGDFLRAALDPKLRGKGSSRWRWRCPRLRGGAMVDT